MLLKSFIQEPLPYIFGLAGQLAPGGTETSEVITGALREATDMTTAVERVKDRLLTLLTSLTDEQVSLKNRGIEVILIGRDVDVMRGAVVEVGFDASTKSIAGRITWAKLGERLLIGDSKAATANSDRLTKRKESIIDAKVSQLQRCSEQLVRFGITVAGPHPLFSSQISCGGACRSFRIARVEPSRNVPPLRG